MKQVKIIALSFLLGIFLLSTYSLADGIKDRMKARKPAIDSLKAAGIVGENNLGFLAFVGEKRDKEDIVKAENQDRTKVYAAIARQQGVSPEDVGKRRAIQIAKIADKGEWLQSAEGKWYQKK